MTNILDTVEPVCWVRPDAILRLNHMRRGNTQALLHANYCEKNSQPLYSRETVERLLAEHRKQVLLEAAEVARGYDDRFGLTGEDDYQCGRMRAAFDIAHELRRMAEGEK